MDFLHKGNTLVVTRIDRLARPVKDLQDIVDELKAKAVTLRATEQPIDTGTPAGKAFLGHAGRVRRIRNGDPQGTADGGDRVDKGCGRL